MEIQNGKLTNEKSNNKTHTMFLFQVSKVIKNNISLIKVMTVYELNHFTAYRRPFDGYFYAGKLGKWVFDKT